MKVSILNKDWEINDITFQQRRKLHKSFMKYAFEKDSDVIYDCYQMALEISGINPDDLGDYTDLQIDSLLDAITTAYLNLEKK